jgi:hypothetical protein
MRHDPAGGNPVPDRAGRPEVRRIPAVAALLAGSVLVSRVMGYAREMVLAYQLGTGPEADAYRAAFQLPDILNYFLAGGAFSIAFVPFYTRTRERAGEAAASRLLATVLGTMTCLAIGATLLMWVFAEPLVALQFGGFADETRALTVRLTRIVLPAQIFFVAGGIVRAALMANDRFATQALAPLLYNGAIITGGGIFGARFGAEGFAWGALVGAALGPLLVPVLDMARARIRLGFRFAPFERDFLAFLWVAAPLMLGLSLLTVDEWYERWFGNRAPGSARSSTVCCSRRCVPHSRWRYSAPPRPSRWPSRSSRCSSSAAPSAPRTPRAWRYCCGCWPSPCPPGWCSRWRSAASTPAAIPGGRCCWARPSRWARSRSTWRWGVASADRGWRRRAPSA